MFWYVLNLCFPIGWMSTKIASYVNSLMLSKELSKIEFYRSYNYILSTIDIQIQSVVFGGDFRRFCHRYFSWHLNIYFQPFYPCFLKAKNSIFWDFESKFRCLFSNHGISFMNWREIFTALIIPKVLLECFIPKKNCSLIPFHNLQPLASYINGTDIKNVFRSK